MEKKKKGPETLACEEKEGKSCMVEFLLGGNCKNKGGLWSDLEVDLKKRNEKRPDREAVLLSVGCWRKDRLKSEAENKQVPEDSQEGVAPKLL